MVAELETIVANQFLTHENHEDILPMLAKLASHLEVKGASAISRIFSDRDRADETHVNMTLGTAPRSQRLRFTLQSALLSMRTWWINREKK